MSKSNKYIKKKQPKLLDDPPIDFNEKIEQIKNDLRENYTQQKKLMNDLSELLSLHKKEVKNSAKGGSKTNNNKQSGFNKPEPIPDSLKNLLKIEEDMLPRSQVTKLMYQYFTKNKMYNKKTKKEIVQNDKVNKIFGMKKDDVINFYNLQTWLKKVYQKNELKNSLVIDC